MPHSILIKKPPQKPKNRVFYLKISLLTSPLGVPSLPKMGILPTLEIAASRSKSNKKS
jgi:hypothetical protein